MSKIIKDMDNLRRFETIENYNVFNSNVTLHPLERAVIYRRQGSSMYLGCYTVLKK